MDFSGQYLTYVEYKGLGGTLAEMPFNLLEFEARKRIDRRTQDRVKNMEDKPQEVKLCVNYMINCLLTYIVDTNVNKNITSESVGSYSVSYISGSQIQDAIKSKKQELNEIMETYLTLVSTSDGVPVLYLGAD